MKFGEKLYRDDLNKISFILNSCDNYLKIKKYLMKRICSD